MKTSEFIEKLDEHRDEILNVENIFSDDELYLTSIRTNQFDITFYHDEEPNEIIDIIAEYLNTPVSEREEEKKYYLRQIGVINRCLFYLPESNRYTTEMKNSNFYIKSQNTFTQSEIDNMPECYKHPAVWEQIEVRVNIND